MAEQHISENSRRIARNTVLLYFRMFLLMLVGFLIPLRPENSERERRKLPNQRQQKLPSLPLPRNNRQPTMQHKPIAGNAPLRNA